MRVFGLRRQRAMAEQRNRWSWDVTGFEPWKSPSPERGDRRPSAPPASRHSMSSSVPTPSAASKVQRLKDEVKVMRFHFQG